MHRVLIMLSVIFLVGCQTSPKKDDVAFEVRDKVHTIDYSKLKEKLGLDHDRSSLGFREAAFNPCREGLGADPKCSMNYFVVINYRLQCRDSNGTISYALTSEDMQPIGDREVAWTLKGLNGISRTDEDGYGTIEAISTIPQKAQRLRLAVGTEFLYIRAGEISRIVTPGTWCD